MNLAHGASLTPGPASPSPADLGLIASSFASFAEIMTGFSFAALAIYLAYESSKGKHADNDETHTIQVGEDSPDAKDWRNTKQGGRQRNPVEVAAHHEVRRSDVAAALFYSMASLAISSFLYASLTSGVEDPSKIAAAILLYGVLFGTSTLTFFYALTLMTYGNSYTRDAARAAYRVLVIFGPAVVSRFLADSAQGAWKSRCTTDACSQENWSPPLIAGMAVLVLLLVFSFLISRTRIFEKWRWLYGISNRLCIRPVLPAQLTFVVAAGVALASVLVSEPTLFKPSVPFIWLTLFAGQALLAFFALACGCVIGIRLAGASRGQQPEGLAARGGRRTGPNN